MKRHMRLRWYWGVRGIGFRRSIAAGVWHVHVGPLVLFRRAW